MTFQLIPVIDAMLEIYRKPPSPDRFREYLNLLQGPGKGDLAVPLGGFNPMAKAQATGRLEELKAQGAEQIASEVSAELNKALSLQHADKTMGIAINLSDDLKGGWTNRYTSDYDSKFKTSALLSRNFCTAIFWTGEDFSTAMIRQRILEYAWRAVYRQSHKAPASLQEHIAQETFVASRAPAPVRPGDDTRVLAEQLYRQHQRSEDYHTIFNFLYGSKASASLEFPVRFGMEDMAGYRYAAALAPH